MRKLFLTQISNVSIEIWNNVAGYLIQKLCIISAGFVEVNKGKKLQYWSPQKTIENQIQKK